MHTFSIISNNKRKSLNAPNRSKHSKSPGNNNALSSNSKYDEEIKELITLMENEKLFSVFHFSMGKKYFPMESKDFFSFSIFHFTRNGK